MPSVYLAPTFGVGWQGFTTGGLPLNAGLINTYAAGTSTPTATYTTSAGNVQNANPIVLGTDGRPPQEIWLVGGTGYKFVLTDSLANIIATYDNISGMNDPVFVNALPLTGGTMTGNIVMSASAIDTAQGANIAAATTTNLQTMTGNYAQVTGTTAVAAITLNQGVMRTVEFATTCVLTNSSTLILPNSTNVSTAAGDVATFVGEAAGVVRVVTYAKANGTPVNPKQPTRTELTAGSGTYTTPTGATRIGVRLVGGGSGGGSATGVSGNAGTNTTFGTLTGSAGAVGISAGGAGGAGGAASGGDVNIVGGTGGGGNQTAVANVFTQGGIGGSSALGGAGGGGPSGGIGGNAAANSGGGGGGAGSPISSTSGGGGGSGGYVEKVFSPPSSTYAYGVGAAGTGGAAGGFAGGNGAAGIIMIDEFYN